MHVQGKDKMKVAVFVTNPWSVKLKYGSITFSFLAFHKNEALLNSLNQHFQM